MFLEIRWKGQLDQTLADIGEDDSGRVVIISANGRAFCVGHDLKEMRENTDKAYLNSLFSKAGDRMEKAAGRDARRLAHLPARV